VTTFTLVLTAFGYAIVWSLTQAALPFYVTSIAPADPAVTLRWLGWVLGAPFPLAIATTPLWIRLGARAPRPFYATTLVLQGLAFAATGLCEDLRLLVSLRLVLGCLGPTTVFGLMVAGGSAPRLIARRVALMQSATTIGTVLGPLVGAAASHRLGYATTFGGAGALFGSCAVLVLLTLPATPARSPEAPHPPGERRDAIGPLALLVFADFSLVSFLTPLLPSLLPRLAVTPEGMLDVAGLVLFLSSGSLACGMLVAPLLARRWGERRSITWCHALGCLVGMGLGLAPSVGAFTTLRSLQTLLLGPVIALVTARTAVRLAPQGLGILNSARMTANFAGPVVSTTMLAILSHEWLFFGLAAAAATCLLWRPVARDSGSHRGDHA
jgi:MFS family permease